MTDIVHVEELGRVLIDVAYKVEDGGKKGKESDDVSSDETEIQKSVFCHDMCKVNVVVAREYVSGRYVKK